MKKLPILILIMGLAGCASTVINNSSNLNISKEDLDGWKQCQTRWGTELRTPNFFVNHFLFFPTKTAAEKAAPLIKALDMDFKIFQDPTYEDEKEWGYGASINMVPNLDKIVTDKQKLKKIAEDNGGRYGDWGLEWNGDNP